MRIFVTGASGWVGSATVAELLAAGHEVVGLARNDASAAAIVAAGAQPFRGSLDDPAGLADAADRSDGVLHLAFRHDFSDFAGAGRTERAAVDAMATALAGSGRPLLLASGIAGLAPGRVATERDPSPFAGPDAPRGGSENLALEYVERDVRVVSLRFAPTVHGQGDHGFIATLVGIAQEKGVAGYIADGSARWAAASRSDVARMNTLAIEKAPAGSILHGVGEEGISTREIAEAIGDQLGLPTVSVAPEDAAAHFGWMARFFGTDMAASSTLTQKLLGWTPSGPTLLQDLESGCYTP